MLTKRTIAETIIIQKNGGRLDTQSSIDARDVYNVVNQVGAEMIAKEAEAQLNRKGQYEIDSSLTTTFSDVRVLYDKARKKCYFRFPASRVSIEGDRDIRLVSFVQGDASPFTIEKAGSARAMNLLEVGQAQMGDFPLTIEGETAYFRTMPKWYRGSKLLVVMIAGIDGLGEDEPLTIPDNMAAQLLERVALFFNVQLQTRVKQSPDGNPSVK